MSSQHTWHVACAEKRCTLAGVFLVMTAALAHAQVISFDASREEFPEVTGWTRVPFCTPEREFDAGTLKIHVTIGGCKPKTAGDRDVYTREIPELVDTSDAFYAEARLITTGPSTEFTGQGPATLDLGSLGPVHYGLTIADDRARLFRSALLPIPFFDLDPRTEHTFRLETHGAALYELYIDAVLVDSGVPEAAYPQFLPLVNWTNRAWMVESTTRWRFVRLGRIPIPGSADFNSDGEVNDFEVFYIDECIQRSAAGEPAAPSCAWCDVNFDATVTCDDFDIIANTLWTGVDPPPELPACVVAPIPAVSDWGVGILALLMLTVATLVYRRSSDHQRLRIRAG